LLEHPLINDIDSIVIKYKIKYFFILRLLWMKTNKQQNLFEI